MSIAPTLHTLVSTTVILAAATAVFTAAGCTPAAAHTGDPAKVCEAGRPTSSVNHDWDWLVGRWTVKHRRLKARLAGSTEWEVFNGSSEVWLTLGGAGTFDDNVIEIPSGTYRATGIRAYNPKTSQWSIWWLDERHPTSIEPPVMGGFKDGVGLFQGDDTLNGRPIKVRFRWTNITANSARWEQAFSPDGGTTWEVNWEMEFARARP